MFIIYRFSRFLKTLIKDFDAINVPSEWELTIISFLLYALPQLFGERFNFPIEVV
jgi:hypothetical protein